MVFSPQSARSSAADPAPSLPPIGAHDARSASGGTASFEHALGLPRAAHRLTRRGALATIASIAAAATLAPQRAVASPLCPGDQFWMLSTRCISSNACAIDLENPSFTVQGLSEAGMFQASGVADLLESIRREPDLPTVIYMHGNRFTEPEAVQRALFVYRNIARHRRSGVPTRFILWSWPSEQVDVLLEDVRIKAERTDAQGLYLAWFLRELVDVPTDLTLIGYSFGGRVATGSLHALAGGALGGRRLPGAHIRGVPVKVGMIAAAINRDWLEPNQYHGLATKNMHRLTIMYNPRDSILRRYWLLDPESISRALGAVGPTRFGTRNDGTRLPVDSINCTFAVGRRHDEQDYYNRECRAGAVFAALIENR